MERYLYLRPVEGHNEDWSTPIHIAQTKDEIERDYYQKNWTQKESRVHPILPCS